MNFESLTLSDLAPLLAHAQCPCHIINPSKTRIILWKDPQDSQTYYLRIGIQKFSSYPLKDKNQEVYWRFQGYDKFGSQAKVNPPDSIKTAKINNHEPINPSEQSESTSH